MIKRKKCKCGCSLYPTMGYAGYFYKCAPENIRERKSKKLIEKRDAATKRYIAKRTEERNSDESKELRDWFLARRKEMTGNCINCGKRSTKENIRFWKWGIAHILPKSTFKSIRTHFKNCMELCIDCHTVYDSNWENASKMKVFITAKKIFIDYLYEAMDEGEHKSIPECFLT